MKTQPELGARLSRLRDLGDLCLQWPELRPAIKEIRDRHASAEPELAQTLDWLMVLADRTFTSEEVTWYKAEDDSGGR